MKNLILAVALVLAGCSQPEAAHGPEPRECPPLPEPLGNTIAAQRAYTLTVIAAYVECAKIKNR